VSVSLEDQNPRARGAVGEDNLTRFSPLGVIRLSV
jgi:hypothetical protein